MQQETTAKNTELIESMFKVGAHFGYSKSRRHPSMAPYIFGAKNKVEIFDLEKTSESLTETKEFIVKCGKEGKKILFVGGKNEARDAVRVGATTISMPYVAGRWIGGTITNFSEIKKRIERLSELMEKREKGELSKFTKLEQLHIDREIENLNKTFGGLRSMKALPDVLFVVDAKQEDIAVSEAKKAGIPIVGILNSDCNMNDVSYHLIGNDAGIASIQFFVSLVVDAYKEGQKQAPQEAAEGGSEPEFSKEKIKE